MILNELATEKLGYVSPGDALGKVFYDFPDERDPKAYTVLGRIVAGAKGRPRGEIVSGYETVFMEPLKNFSGSKTTVAPSNGIRPSITVQVSPIIPGFTCS